MSGYILWKRPIKRVQMGGLAMGAVDKAKDKLEEAEGRVKRTVGAATNDPVVEAEGRAKETSGDLKQAGEKVKDAVGRQ